MRLLVQKLSFKLREKWRTKANEIFERTGQRACFPDIVNFIEHQIRIISDPVFGGVQDVQSAWGIARPSKPQIRSQFK